MEELLHQWNPWWTERKVPDQLVGIKRPKYTDPLLGQANDDRVSIVTGPRRAGKTTVMHQVIAGLIASGTDPKNVMYTQLDHPAIDANIGDIIREFKKVNEISAGTQIYVFLDEAQYAKDWARWAKSIHDLKGAKLFISGSSTGIIENDAYASLTGRWQKTMVWPLDFGEYLLVKGLTIGGADRYLESSYLRQYIRTGGFPEAVLRESVRDRLLTDLFEDMVLKDAARSRNIRDSTALRQIAVFMAGSLGKPASINKMKNTFKMSSDAISGYIDALCSAYLFFPCPYHSKSANERIYNPKKYYMIDTGMAHAVLGTLGDGAAVENLLALHYWKRGGIGYWKSNYELDLVINDGKAALESKYQNKVEMSSLKGGLEFAKVFKLKRLYVATDDLEDERKTDGKTVEFLPASRILLGKGGP